MKDNIAYEKAFVFAVKIVKIYKFLSTQKREYILSKQVLRSGTAIGANIKESIYAQSKKDFLSKMSIALKEASETEYWLKLLVETEYLDRQSTEPVIKECIELIKLLTSITKTVKQNLNK